MNNYYNIGFSKSRMRRIHKFNNLKTPNKILIYFLYVIHGNLKIYSIPFYNLYPFLNYAI